MTSGNVPLLSMCIARNDTTFPWIF